MTVNELCEVFSTEISKSFDLNKDLIQKQLFEGTSSDMSEEEVYAKMITNSIILSANLSTKVIITGLVTLGVIPKDYLDAVKLKPQLHLVKSDKKPSDPLQSSEE